MVHCRNHVSEQNTHNPTPAFARLVVHALHAHDGAHEPQHAAEEEEEVPQREPVDFAPAAEERVAAVVHRSPHFAHGAFHARSKPVLLSFLAPFGLSRAKGKTRATRQGFAPASARRGRSRELRWTHPPGSWD